MVSRLVLVFAIISGFADPALPCDVPAPLPSADSLVRSAEVIARVRAEGISPTPGVGGNLAASRTQVRFTILEVLKGGLPSTTIAFNGSLNRQ